MTSIYDDFAIDCAALAAKTKRKSDKVRLLLLAAQRRVVAAEQPGNPLMRPLSDAGPELRPTRVRLH
jgi:hypothetical protein